MSAAVAACGARRDPRRRQLRQLRLQPRAVPRASSAPSARCVRNDEVDAGRRARVRRRAAQPRARARPRRPASASSWCARSPATVPVLGVCLGHQAIAVGVRRRSWSAPPSCCTARPAPVAARRRRRAGRPADPFTATRYHSLAVEPTTAAGRARGHRRAPPSGVIMALRHRDLPLEGVQFHPESVLTEGGHRLLANWLAACGDPDAPRPRRRAGTGRHPRLTGRRPTAGRSARRSAGWSASTVGCGGGRHGRGGRRRRDHDVDVRPEPAPSGRRPPTG